MAHIRNYLNCFKQQILFLFFGNTVRNAVALACLSSHQVCRFRFSGFEHRDTLTKYLSFHVTDWDFWCRMLLLWKFPGISMESEMVTWWREFWEILSPLLASHKCSLTVINIIAINFKGFSISSDRKWAESADHDSGREKKHITIVMREGGGAFRVSVYTVEFKASNLLSIIPDLYDHIQYDSFWWVSCDVS